MQVHGRFPERDEIPNPPAAVVALAAQIGVAADILSGYDSLGRQSRQHRRSIRDLDASDTGALVRLADTRCFLKVNAGTVSMLNQRAVAVAVALQMAERQQYAPEMVTVEEWERTRPPPDDERDTEAQRRTGSTGGVTPAEGHGVQPAPLAPRRH